MSGEESQGMYFGNQRNTKYNTLYNVDFNKDYDMSNLRGLQKEREGIADKIKQAHILLGDNPQSYYVTEQKSNFEKKRGDCSAATHDTKELM